MNALFLVALILFVNANVGHTNILLVPTLYPTIQLAVNETQSGDTVLIEFGEYPEMLTIPDHDLTIAGRFLFTGDSADIDSAVCSPPAGPDDLPHLQATGLSATTRLNLIGIRWRGNYVPGIGERRGGIVVRGGELRMSYCHIDSVDAVITGVLSVSRTDANIEHCHFRDSGSRYHQPGFSFVGGTNTIRNCIFERLFDDGDGSNSIFFTDDTLEIRDSRITGCAYFVSRGISLVDAFSWGALVIIAGCEIDSNFFWHFIAQESNNQSLLVEFRIDSNYIHDNAFFMNMYEGSNRRLRLQFVGNVFEHNGDTSRAVYSRCCFNIGELGQRFMMTRNLFLNNYMYGTSVVGINNGNPQYVQIFRNYIIGNVSIDVLNPPGAPVRLSGGTTGVFYENVLQGNRPYAARNGFTDSPIAHAENNYWGHETGPYHPTENPLGQGDSVDARIIVTPWFTDTTLSSTRREPTPLIVDDFIFGNAYPNPFNDAVTFEFAVLRDAEVRLAIYDVGGRLVTTLLDDERRTGVHTVSWQPQQTASGVYFARLIMGHETAMKKVLYLK